MRTVDDLYRKFEQLFDATERGVLSNKQIDGMTTQLKQMKSLGIEMPIRLMTLIAKYGKGGTANVPTPRGVMLRTYLGLPEQPSADDRAKLTPGGLR